MIADEYVLEQLKSREREVEQLEQSNERLREHYWSPAARQLEISGAWWDGFRKGGLVGMALLFAVLTVGSLVSGWLRS